MVTNSILFRRLKWINLRSDAALTSTTNIWKRVHLRYKLFLLIIYAYIRDANSVDESGVDEQPPTSAQKKTLKKATDRWTHDFFDASEQAPKSRTELVNSYGYDIRNEDGPPKTRRNRRYK